MNKEIIPVFYDQSSFKSILTFAKEKECLPGGPISIVSICKEHGIKKCVFVSKSFTTFIDAWKNLKAVGTDLIFGIELVMCNDAKVHTEESRHNEHKVIVMMKNKNGYQDLLKIYTACHSDIENKYFVQRFDYKQLKKLWSDNLLLVIPFFDSFIAKNLLEYGAAIVPDMSFTTPTIFREVNSDLPFVGLINDALDAYNKANKYPEFKVKTIYYKNRDDFRAYSVYRAIMNKETHVKPNIEHFGSREFCFESYLEAIK